MVEELVNFAPFGIDWLEYKKKNLFDKKKGPKIRLVIQDDKIFLAVQLDMIKLLLPLFQFIYSFMF